MNRISVLSSCNIGWLKLDELVKVGRVDELVGWTGVVTAQKNEK